MKHHKGNPRKKAKIVLPPPSSAPDPSTPPPTGQPPPPPSAKLFPNYPSPSSTSSTPLPPPSMPKKRFLRRILPLVLVGCAATYTYMRTSKKHVPEQDGEITLEVSSIPAQSTETTSS